MNRLITLLAVAASLYGCDIGTVTTVQRVSDAGRSLHSRVVARPGLARFDCLASSDGSCRYTLYRRDCRGARATGDCRARPLAAFSVASGGHRALAGLPAFHVCVRGTTPALQAGCGDARTLAAR